MPIMPPVGRLRAARPAKRAPVDTSSTTFDELNEGTSRMIDTFIYDYPALVRDHDEPFATVVDPDARVAIIGSGFAGFTAAYELRRAKVEHIDMYEARDKLGGRVDTREFVHRDKPYYNEMGAMRVPENSKLFWHYLQKIQDAPGSTRVERFPNPGVVATQMLYEGQQWTWIGDALPEPWATIQADINRFIEDALTYRPPHGRDPITLAMVAGYLTEPTMTDEQVRDTKAYWSHFLDQYVDVSLVEALQQYFDGQDGRPRWGPEEFNMFSSLGFGTGGFGPLYPACFLEIFRLLLWSYDQEYIPNIPMTRIIETFADVVKPTMRHETVTFVGLDRASSGKKVDVYSLVDGKEHKRQYDYVIVATTLRSMQVRMNLDGAVAPRRYADASQAVFPHEAVADLGSHNNDMLRQSIRIPHVMNSSKLFGLLPTKPWSPSSGIEWPTVRHEGRDHPVKCVLTDTLARQMYFLDPYQDDPHAGSNLLISYNWGDDSVKVMAVEDYAPQMKVDPDGNGDYTLKVAYQDGLETTGTCTHVAETLDQITADQPDRLQSIFWQKEPMIFGAFKIDYPQQYPYTSQTVYQYQYATHGHPGHSHRVFLANNNCSYQGGWIEGAMQSAVNAASAVLEVMSAEGQAKDFRMDPLFQPNPFASTLGKMVDALKRKRLAYTQSS